MIKRATRIAGLVGVTGALALGGVGVAQASNGADDPPGQHQEHANGEAHHHHNGKGHHHNGKHHHGEKGHHHGHGQDDGPNHHRHGNDDGPNHT